MGEITLVRHGQANSSATTEAEYDRLSELGRRQAAWLGDHLRAHEAPFDRVLTGTLRRHRETAEAMGRVGAGEVEEDPRLDEMAYFDLGRALEERHGVPFPHPGGFADHIPKVMDAWERDEISGGESFERFEARVTGILEEAAEPGRRVLCVTSGGVIGMAVRNLLGLDSTHMARILLPIANSSIHRVRVTPNGRILSLFNAHPHLDHRDRAGARTHF